MSRRNDPRYDSARAALALVLEHEKEHVDWCQQCTTAGEQKHNRCDTGWYHAKLVARARYAAAEHDKPDPPQPPPDPLW